MSDRSYWVDAYGDTYRSLITQDVADTLADKASDELYEGEFYDSAMAFWTGLTANWQSVQIRWGG